MATNGRLRPRTELVAVGTIVCAVDVEAGPQPTDRQILSWWPIAKTQRLPVKLAPSSLGVAKLN